MSLMRRLKFYIVLVTPACNNCAWAHLFTINPVTQVATYRGTITGTSTRTYGVVLGENNVIYLSGGEFQNVGYRLHSAVIDPATTSWSATPLGSQPYWLSGDLGDCSKAPNPFALDFADAPDPAYPTLLANNGARHYRNLGNIYLGNTIDYESDGLPSVFANGDNNDNLNDEDGVTFSSFTAGQSSTVAATVTNNTGGSATLYGFIDFNGDGDFDDTGEALTANVSDGTTNGAIILTFNVPTNAETTKNICARFRLSTDPGLGGEGLASDGEVEDYMVYVLPPAAPELTLKKTATPSTYTAVGDVISYSYLVTNSGNVNLHPPYSIADDKVTVSCPQIPNPLLPGGSITGTATYTITQADIDAGSVTNEAIATAGGNVTSNPDTVTVTGPVTGPAINLDKVGTLNDDDGTSGVSPGDTISYVFTVTNTGNVTLTNVTLSDPKLTVIGGPIISLVPGVVDNTTFSGSYTITQADIDAGTFTNTATATGTSPTGGSVGKVSDQGSDTQLLENPVPTLSEWGMMILALLMALVGVAVMRRRERQYS